MTLVEFKEGTARALSSLLRKALEHANDRMDLAGGLIIGSFSMPFLRLSFVSSLATILSVRGAAGGGLGRKRP